MKGYFNAIQSYWLMKQGDVMRSYTESIFDKIASRAEWWHPAALIELWQGCAAEYNTVGALLPLEGIWNRGSGRGNW